MIVYTKQGERIKLKSENLKQLKKVIAEAQKIAYKENIMAFITCLEGDDEHNVLLRNRDVVFIPKARQTVRVSGQVASGRSGHRRGVGDVLPGNEW